MVNIANEARIPIDCEVFGLFRDLIPAQLMEEGGELGYCRQRNGFCPDFKLLQIVVKTFIENEEIYQRCENIIYPIRTRNTVAKSHKHQLW